MPSESVRRLLALRAAGVLDLVELGQDYACDKERCSVITQDRRSIEFDLMIDATGQRKLAACDLPFKTSPACTGRSRELQYVRRFCMDHDGLGSSQVIMLALPYLLARKPFAQGLVACDEIAKSADEAIVRSGSTAPSQNVKDLLAFGAEQMANPALVPKPELAAVQTSTPYSSARVAKFGHSISGTSAWDHSATQSFIPGRFRIGPEDLGMTRP